MGGSGGGSSASIARSCGQGMRLPRGYLLWLCGGFCAGEPWTSVAVQSGVGAAATPARDDPQAQRTSIYAWSLWAAAQDRLPPQVCGTSVTAHDLQDQVFGPAGNPW